MTDAAKGWRRDALVAGGLYLLIIVTAGFAEGGVRAQLIDWRDAGATAEAIRAGEMLFRAGITADAVAFLADVALAFMLYRLFRAVSNDVALLAAFFRLAQAAALGLNLTHEWTALQLVTGPVTETGIDVAGLDAAARAALALTAMEAHRAGYILALFFFGVHCLVMAWLIMKAEFAPRVLGWLVALAGLCYLADGFATILAPAFADTVSTLIIAPVVLAELAFALWLLAAGLRLAARKVG